MNTKQIEEAVDKRFRDLTDRLISVGRPADHFSCSEFHELHDGIKELEAEIKKLKQMSTNRGTKIDA
jgi:hypothetical protein